ncbi:hypothetical protein [Tenuibacillus multivorans]|uniref:CDP-glycerol glycerophosphotransferase, TagB/SpsB family n=1 Tax=Tenuibacillus multivorans TaxID=237069 RepID=A0A1G9YQ57_9BACI|nr:hypothetical protein [Tenuibacillus multivorans]GEL78486.1 spore coat polysaccharide biosynthesis protein SpsB [Tenuibacillus multivorans]SDN10653.1 CDP-glycerol glycerophosphotransferase, TagB/SpsB family [Tenuibacillus multivorans]
MEQLDLYLSRYWSLYLDFLDAFEDIKYKGYSLPYLCHFRSLIKHNKHIMNGLQEHTLDSILKNQVQYDTEIQERYNTYINQHTKPRNNHKNGKIILHDVYNLLRFPNDILKQHFNPKKTIILKDKHRGNISSVGEFPVQTFDHYPILTSYVNKKLNKLIKKTKTLFDSYHDHPLFMDDRFQNNFLNQIKSIVKRIEETKQLLSKVKISSIIVPSTHYPESRTLVVVAAAHGIPSICMQHGIISGEPGYLPKIATVDAVYGHFEKDWFQAKGVEDDTSLSIIGHPRFDLLFSTSPTPQLKFYKKLGLDADKKTILLGVRGEQDLQRWRKLIRHLLRKDLFNILVRDFPNNKPHQLVKEFPQLYSTQDFSLYDVLHQVDAVVVYPSTIGLEAMLIDKPTFILDADFPGYTGYYNRLEELVQRNPSALAVKIVKYFKNKKMMDYANKQREEFLSYAYPQKELSTRRLIRLIRQLNQNNDNE